MGDIGNIGSMMLGIIGMMGIIGSIIFNSKNLFVMSFYDKNYSGGVNNGSIYNFNVLLMGI